MLRFQPSGFRQHSIPTPLGKIAYYSPTCGPWETPDHSSAATTSSPTLIFFHTFGGGASAYEWSQVYAVFSASHRVIAPDLVGWGASDHPARQYTAEDYLNTIESFIRKVSTEPVIAVASSFTAGLVTRLATQHPTLFHRLFLTCPAGFKDFGESAERRLPAPVINLPFLDKAIYTVGATNEFAVRNFLENFLFSRPTRLSPETVAAYLASAQQPNAEYAALAFLKSDLYFDLAPYLSQLTTPTAIVWGEKARFTPVSTGKKLAALNPEAVQRFQVVSDTGVLPHLEQPGVVASLLLDWLAD